MDLKAAILKEHSKKQALMIADYIGNNQERFDELMTHFFSNEYRVTQRAAWVMSHCMKNYPNLIQSHLKRMIQNLRTEKIHVAVKRNSVRFLQTMEIPENLMGISCRLLF